MKIISFRWNRLSLVIIFILICTIILLARRRLLKMDQLERTKDRKRTVRSHLKNARVEDKVTYIDEALPSQECKKAPKGLYGDISVDEKELVNWAVLAKSHPEVKVGGLWRPKLCLSHEKLAVIIPFRDPYGDRFRNLYFLIKQLHLMLQRQQLDYRIYVIQQNGSEGWFNKGMIMNIGFDYINKTTDCDCLVFQDVDLIPVDDRNMYICEDLPKHLSPHINGKTTTYQQLVGGVLMMKKNTFVQVNGYSNNFWGWGNEDDNMWERMRINGMQFTRPSPKIGRYIHLRHRRSYMSTNYRPSDTNVNRIDGLNNLHKVNWTVLEVKRLQLYTWINVDLIQPK